MQLAVKSTLDRLDELVRARRSEKSQVAIRDPQHGNLRVAHNARGTKQRAVSAQGNHKLAGGGVLDVVRVALLVMRPHGLDALARKPMLKGMRAFHGIRARVVWDDKDLHANLQPNRCTEHNLECTPTR